MTEKPEIESREVTLYMVVEETEEDMSSEQEIKVIVPLTMTVVEVLDRFVSTIIKRPQNDFLIEPKGVIKDYYDY